MKQEHTRIVDRLVDAVTAAGNVPRDSIYTSSRQEIHARPRQVLSWAMSDMLGIGLKDIGAILGRDHSTVIFGRERIRSWIEHPDQCPVMVRLMIDAAQRVVDDEAEPVCVERRVVTVCSECRRVIASKTEKVGFTSPKTITNKFNLQRSPTESFTRQVNAILQGERGLV